MRNLSVVYELNDALYLNITNRCTNDCTFCLRKKLPQMGGEDLWLQREPSVDELLAAVGDPSEYRELVYCGYGEPLYRLKLIKQASRRLRADPRTPDIRVNTNGLGNLIHRRNIIPELKGLLDAVSISLNAENAEKYVNLCRPHFGYRAYEAVIDFARECRKYIPRVIFTVVDLPEVNIGNCRAIARDCGVEFKVRPAV